MESVGFPLDEHVKAAAVEGLNFAFSSLSYRQFFVQVGERHARSYFCVSTPTLDWLSDLYSSKFRFVA